MGRMQILFIVLSVIIVGVAVAWGITHVGTNAVTANNNAVLLDLNDIARRAQNWYRASATMGGGNGTFEAIDFDALGLTSGTGGTLAYANNNASIVGAGYTISNRTATSFDVEARGNERAIHYTCTITNDGIATGPTLGAAW